MPEVVNSGDVGTESWYCGWLCGPICVAACAKVCVTDGPLPFADVLGLAAYAGLFIASRNVVGS